MKTFLIATALIGLLIAARTNQDNGRANVNQLQGLYVFTDATPAHDFEYLGTVENGIRLAGSSQYQPVRDRLIKKVKEKYPDAEGIIFHFVNNAADKAEAIRFK